MSLCLFYTIHTHTHTHLNIFAHPLIRTPFPSARTYTQTSILTRTPTYTYPSPPRTPGPLPLEPTKEFLLANADSLAAAAKPVVKQKKTRFRSAYYSNSYTPYILRIMNTTYDAFLD